jgi:hypothetical protein
MLLTWKRWICDTNDETGKDEERQVLQGSVVPDCCEAVQKHLSVVLSYGWDDLTDTPACAADAPEGVTYGDANEGNDWKSSMERWLEEQPEEVRKVTRFHVAKPLWSAGCAVDYNLLRAFHDGPPPDPSPPGFCPHCGTPLPEIERVPEAELPGPIHEPVGDGDYCGTCDERSRNCICMFPECAWRTVPDSKGREESLLAQLAAQYPHLDISPGSNVRALVRLLCATPQDRREGLQRVVDWMEHGDL